MSNELKNIIFSNIELKDYWLLIYLNGHKEYYKINILII